MPRQQRASMFSMYICLSMQVKLGQVESSCINICVKVHQVGSKFVKVYQGVSRCT